MKKIIQKNLFNVQSVELSIATALIIVVNNFFFESASKSRSARRRGRGPRNSLAGKSARAADGCNGTAKSVRTSQALCTATSLRGKDPIWHQGQLKGTRGRSPVVYMNLKLSKEIILCSFSKLHKNSTIE
jgi:hypothetical protein